MKNDMKTKEMYDVLRKDILKAIGLVIRRKRRRVNMSQQELADVLGVTKSSVSRYEAGKTEIPTSSLPVISDCCRFPVKEFVDVMQSEIDLSSVENIEEYHLTTDEKVGDYTPARKSSLQKKDKPKRLVGYFGTTARYPFTITFQDLEDYNNGIRTNPKFTSHEGAYLRTMAVAYKCWKEDGYNKEECSNCHKSGLFCKRFEELIK